MMEREDSIFNRRHQSFNHHHQRRNPNPNLQNYTLNVRTYNLNPVVYVPPKQEKMREQKYHRPMVKKNAFSLMICFAGVVYQLISILVDYFHYKMVSEVVITKVDNVTPPAMSLCLPYVELMDLSKLGFNHAPWNKMTKDEREALNTKVQNNVTIEQIFSFTPKLQDLMIEFWSRKPGTFTIDSTLDNIIIKKFVREEFICYKFYYAESDDPYFHLKSHQITYGREPGSIMMVALDKKKLNHVSKAAFYLNNYDMYPRGDRDYLINMVNENGSVFQEAATFWGISYMKYTLNLLPPPFRTSCKDYKKIGFDSEYHCQDDCLKNQTIAKYGRKNCIFSATFTDPRDISVLSKYSVFRNQTLEKELDVMIDNCNFRSCPGFLCTKKWYVPQLYSRRDSNRIVWQLFDMNGPEYVLTFKPHVTFIGLLINIISVCGIWMGISCADVVRRVFTVIESVCVVYFMFMCGLLCYTLTAIPEERIQMTHARVTRVPVSVILIQIRMKRWQVMKRKSC